MPVPKVLLISSDEAESTLMEKVLCEHVNLACAINVSELHTLLETGNFDAVLCGWSFHKGAWNTALEKVQQQNADLPVVIFCREGSDRELADVLNAGAFDLLVAPYLASTVVPIVQHAVVSYEGRKVHRLARRRVYGHLAQPTPMAV